MFIKIYTFSGVHGVLVALLAAKVEIKYDPTVVSPPTLASSITDLGFQATVLDEAGNGDGEVELRVRAIKTVSRN